MIVTRAVKYPFPPVYMILRIRIRYPTPQENFWELHLAADSVTPKKPFTAYTEQPVVASGFALFDLECHPYYQGCEFVDAKNEPIPHTWAGFDNFHATSTMELATLARLYIAAVGTILAALGLILIA